MSRFGLHSAVAVFTENFGLGRTTATAAVVVIAGAALAAASWFFTSAPPTHLIITSGPAGSIFQADAEKYRTILARNGVTLTILSSQGSPENFTRLNDPKFRVDVGFVQGGMNKTDDVHNLVSLGSMFYQPLLVFCRSEQPVDTLSALAGKRIAIGPEGSGTHALALTLLDANGIKAAPGTASAATSPTGRTTAPATGEATSGGEGGTTLLNTDADEAAAALQAGTIDAVFLMGDSASPQVIRALLHNPDIRLINFSQADAYTRKFPYLEKLDLPMGSIDFGKNIPSRDVYLVGPTVELIARESLHPALSDLLLEAAQEVHGRTSLFQHHGEFPSATEHDIPLSSDALRYYKSGKGYLYRTLPFWLASLVTRLAVFAVPLVVLIPGLRVIPAAYKWRIRLRIYRWYRALMTLEREHQAHPEATQRQGLIRRLDHIEDAVKAMNVPASFADQLYALRSYITFVRTRLTDSAKSGAR